jgi:hypothetical protein
MKDPQFLDFIGIFPEALSKKTCDEIINAHHELNQLNEVVQGRVGGKAGPEIVKAAKNSTDVELGAYHNYRNLLYEVSTELQNTYNVYMEKYWQINEYLNRHDFTAWQIQKYDYKDHGGYHYFHIENSGVTSMRRVMAYILYLNDVKEGGETEFLHQALRVKPETGKLVIFPAYFTHVHRGNPIISKEDKYIMTGWMEYV